MKTKNNQKLCPTCGMPVRIVGASPDFTETGDKTEGCTMRYEPDLPSENEIAKIIKDDFELVYNDDHIIGIDLKIVARHILKRIKEGK